MNLVRHSLILLSSLCARRRGALAVVGAAVAACSSTVEGTRDEPASVGTEQPNSGSPDLGGSGGIAPSQVTPSERGGSEPVGMGGGPPVQERSSSCDPSEVSPCASDLSCVGDDQAGVCRTECNSDAACPAGPCLADSAARRHCYRSCLPGDSTCDPGLDCVDYSDLGGDITGFVCDLRNADPLPLWADCVTGWFCPTGSVCDAGTCRPRCESSADCAGESCVEAELSPELGVSLSVCAASPNSGTD